jgi:hypothetical protein
LKTALLERNIPMVCFLVTEMADLGVSMDESSLEAAYFTGMAGLVHKHLRPSIYLTFRARICAAIRGGNIDAVKRAFLSCGDNETLYGMDDLLLRCIRSRDWNMFCQLRCFSGRGFVMLFFG